jgi:hypothetical protein
MRRLISRITLLAASLMILSVPVLADDMSGVQQREPAAMNPGKDVCLVFAMNCDGRAESIEDTIRAIKREIKKGNAVYTNEELGILQRKLEQEQRDLYESTEGGA